MEKTFIDKKRFSLGIKSFSRVSLRELPLKGNHTEPFVLLKTGQNMLLPNNSILLPSTVVENE